MSITTAVTPLQENLLCNKKLENFLSENDNDQTMDSQTPTEKNPSASHLGDGQEGRHQNGEGEQRATHSGPVDEDGDDNSYLEESDYDDFDFSDDYSVYEINSESEEDWYMHEDELRASASLNPDPSSYILTLIKNNTRLGPSSVNSIKKSIELVQKIGYSLKRYQWSSLWKNIQEIDKLLFRADSFNQLKSLGPLLPVFSRLFDEIERSVIKNPDLHTKKYRQRLAVNEAKALHILAQKWPKWWKQGLNLAFRQIIHDHSASKPEILVREPRPHATRSVLDSFENVLLGLDFEMSLSYLYLRKLPVALINIHSIVKWYLDFIPKPSRRTTSTFSAEEEASLFLKSIKAIDLSHNLFTTLPKVFPLVFPNLELLDLTENPLQSLPRTTTRWSNMYRIKINRAMRMFKYNYRGVELDTNWRIPVPTLVESCLTRLKKNMKENSPNGLIDSEDQLPHLSKAFNEGTLCESCGRFVWPDVQPFYSPITFVYPGEGTLKVFPLGPSSYCKVCIRYHFTFPLAKRDCRCEMCIFDRLGCSRWVHIDDDGHMC